MFKRPAAMSYANLVDTLQLHAELYRLVRLPHLKQQSIDHDQVTHCGCACKHLYMHMAHTYGWPMLHGACSLTRVATEGWT